MLGEFKKFALRGNAVDLAIGVIIGAAFGAIVNSLGFAGRGQETRRRSGVGKFPHRPHQLHHRCLGLVHRRQGDEPDYPFGAAGAGLEQSGNAAHRN